MRQSRADGGQLSVAARTNAAERIIQFLRRTHPLKTAECVAAETGVSVDTVQKWIDRGSAPSGPYILLLVCAYGPEFLHAALESPPDWLSRVRREERLKKIEAEIAALEGERAGLS